MKLIKHNTNKIYLKINSIILFCFFSMLSLLQAQSLLSESFNYSSGTLLTANNWTALAGTGTNNVTVSNGNLAFPGSIGNGMGSKIPLANNGQDVSRTFTSTAAPIYSSLIVNVSAANAAGDFFYSIGTSAAPATTVGAKLFVKSNGSGFSFGVLRGTGGIPVYETTVRPFNTNVMVVLKYEVVAGATNDAVKLYVNPGLSSEPATPDAIYTAAIGLDAGAFSAIALVQGTAVTAPTLEVDGINVGTTWASVTSPIYDYGDVPTTYDFTKDGVYAPAAHSLLAGLALGSNIPDLELSPLSVASGADNNGSNGDGADEDAINISANQIRKGVPFTLSVPVTNPAATTKFLYGWIDFNNDGLFQVGELSDAIITFTTTGATTQTLTWSAAKTATITSATKLYMRLRLSDRSLNDFTTAASGGALIDERAVGNGAVSTANAADFPTAANGEVEDYQIDVVTTFDYGDAPSTFENDKDGNPLPGLNAPLIGFSIGSLLDVESTPASVTSPAENNTSGDNTIGQADEDGLISLTSVSRGVAYSLTVPVTIPSTLAGTKYLYGWLDLNGDGRFQIGEVASITTAATTAANLTLTWTAAQTATLVSGTTKVYLRLRLSNLSLIDFTTAASGGALIDERSVGNGATAAAIATNSPNIAFGEIEDYQLPVDLYDFGDVPVSYDNSKDGVFLPAGQIQLAGLSLGSILPDVEQLPYSVAAGANNNGSNGDGADEDAIDVSVNQIRKGVMYTLSVPVANPVASTKYLYGWIDFNNDGLFQVGELSDAIVTFVTTGATTQTLTWSAAKTATISSATKLYMRLRLSDRSLNDFTTAASGGALIDERSVGFGAVSTANAADFGVASNGEVEDYQIDVVNTYEYGDLPVSYEQPGGTFLPARQLLSSSLKIGATTDIESAAQSVAAGADNNGTNGDGLDEDGINPTVASITLGTAFTLPVNVTNISGAASALYGWLDINKNGVLEVGEVATAAVSTGTNGTAVNLSWTSAQTANISGTEVYLRLRLAGTALADNAATVAYDERAFADGLNTGIYGTAPGIGEIEDYRISVNPGYDFGDVPVSYDQPAGILIPARQVPSATLRIGNTTPDIEYNAQSVATDTDNNGTNGDGLDEDGVNPALHPVTPTSIFTLPVNVTNTSGAGRTLYGWLDVNNNGIFEAAEGTTFLVANNATTVNLTWTAAVTGRIASSHVYLRLRFTTAGLSDSGATIGYDERAFADGVSTGVYGTAPGIGEIEDYRLAVNAVFDFGDAPESFEVNNAIDVVPARHIPASTLYLGSIYDTESSNNAVAAGANNSGLNGDGADEDGISGTLPQLNSTTTSYSVNVNVYKTIAGTATLHGWIDMDGNGRFSAVEYSSVAVTGTVGAQTAVLTWSAPFYFDTGAATSYMRLRFTTATLTDNATTDLVDERSIGDGLNSGVYGTIYANGEIEDYPVPLPTPIIIDPNLDSDGDGVPDLSDLDDDNDGILDATEGPVSLNDSAFKLYNTPNYQGTTAYRWNIYVTGTAGTTVTYTPYGGAATPAVIPASGILVINLLPAQVPNWPLNTVTSGKYVQVSSSSPVSILQEIQGDPAADDATVVYPPSVWGTKYTVNAYPSTGRTNGVQIFSATDNNMVVVKNKAGATVASFTLNNGQNYVYDNGAPDSTGFTVTSTKSVGVMTYSICAFSTTIACDNLVEYLLPDRLLGTKFLTRSAANTGRMSITAIRGATAVKVDGAIVTVLNNPGDTYTYTQAINTSEIIETSSPVQFTKIVPYDYDPSITTIQDVTKATLGPAIMSIPTTMTTSNSLTIFVKTGSTGKMLYNGNPISGWAPFSYDSTYSYATLTNVNGITAGSLVNISSTTGDVPFMTDWYGVGTFITAATPLSIGGVSVVSGTNSANSYRDTDGDGIPDYLDLDSDNDGCLDALEGDENVVANQLVNAGGTLTVGTGSTASNKNLCASGICVDAQGVPKVVNSGGAADVSGNQGQGIGDSENSSIQDAVCLLTPFCYKPGITTGTALDSKVGITSLSRAGATDPDNWPMVRKGAWLVVESKTKGFVVNRLPFDGSGNPIGIPVADFTEGMMVYDTVNNCLKMYTSTDGGFSFSWQCLNTQTCPD